MFSCMPGDDRLSAALARGMSGEKELTLISATDHDSRAFAGELKKATGFRPAFHVEFEPGSGAARAAARARTAPAVVLVAGAGDSARFLRALRALGFRGRIYAGPWAARMGALDAAEGVIFPFPLERATEDFPDYAGAYAYEATNLVIGAIRKAGLNRAGIYDAIRSDYPGRNAHPVRLATVRSGRVVILPQPGTR